MKITKIIYFLFLVVLLSGQNQAKPFIKKGVLDLQSYDFEENIQLDGEWFFAWKEFLLNDIYKRDSTKFIYVPGSWMNSTPETDFNGQGFATYALQILLPKEEMHYQLKILPMGTSYRLYINGSFTKNVGYAGINKEETVAKYEPSVISIPQVEDTLSLVFQVSNFESARGGLWYSIEFGEAEKISKSFKVDMIKDVFLFGAFLIIGIYHFGLFIIRRKDKFSLYFAFLTTFMAIRTTITETHFLFFLFPDIDYAIQIRLIYFTLYALFVSFLLFFKNIFKNEFNNFITSIIITAGLFFVLSVGFSVLFFTNILYYFHVFAGISATIGLYFLYRAVKNNRLGSRISGIGFGLFFLTSFNDILYAEHVINTGYFMGYGLLLFVIAQSMVISHWYSDAFKKLEISLAKEKEFSDENIKLQFKMLELNKDLERKIEERTESLLFAKKEAEKASEAKSAFVATMSHELRTPLNAIIGYAQLLSERDFIDKEDKERISIINQSGLHLLDLINSILELSKIEAGKTDFVKSQFELEVILKSIISMFDLRVLNKNIYLRMRYASKVPRNICTDEQKLRQILINLIGNAIKFTEIGGVELIVELKSKNTLQFIVKDTGIGIPEKNINKILQPFEQVSSEDSLMGTGLGLPISYNFAKILGGTFTISSVVNKGTQVFFEIPFEEVEELHFTSESSVIHGIKNRKQINIGLISNDFVQKDLLKEFIEPVGFNIISIKTTEDLQESEAFILDVGGAGKHVIEMFQTIEIKQPIIVLSTTLEPLPETKNKMFRLVKPISKKKIFDKLSEVLDLEYEIEERFEEEGSLKVDFSASDEFRVSKEFSGMLEALEIGDLELFSKILSESFDKNYVDQDFFELCLLFVGNFQMEALEKIFKEI